MQWLSVRYLPVTSLISLRCNYMKNIGVRLLNILNQWVNQTVIIWGV
jgi:hypothetical protein